MKLAPVGPAAEIGDQAGALIEEGNGSRTTYTIWHPLAISHLTNGLSAPRRASLHRRAADVLRQVYQEREEEGAAAIASHLVNGGAEPSLIVRYAELAGEYAYRLSAYHEAARYYRLALGSWEMAAAASSPVPVDSARQALLFERLGECAMVQGQYGEAEQCYTRVIELRSGSHLQEEAPLLALCWAEIGWAKRYLGEIAEEEGETETARACYAEALELLRDVWDVNRIAAVLRGVTKMEATDKSTLKLTLDKPNADLLANLCSINLKIIVKEALPSNLGDRAQLLSDLGAGDLYASPPDPPPSELPAKPKRARSPRTPVKRTPKGESK